MSFATHKHIKKNHSKQIYLISIFTISLIAKYYPIALQAEKKSHPIWLAALRLLQPIKRAVWRERVRLRYK